LVPATSRDIVRPYVRELHAASTPAAHSAARNALAGSVRALCVITLRRNDVPSDVADDLAQSMTLLLVRRIEEGSVAEGSEDSYVRASARNRARDHHRDQSGLRARWTLIDELDAIAGDETTTEDRLVGQEEAGERACVAERLRVLLDLAPERYRALLVQVYLMGQPIETLAVAELIRRGACNDDRRERRRARAAVDKQLQRARVWLRDRLTTRAVSREGRVSDARMRTVKRRDDGQLFAH